jgi:peptidoglycan/LPS O-acetylase OafA/YrhL
MGNASTESSAGLPPRRTQLDGLRAWAIGGVLVSHFLHDYWGIPWGQIGVRLFFVLSGFLITGILLRCREAAERGGGSRWWGMRQFYLRRFLRIFPIYYFVIGVALLLGLEPTRALLGWLLTYTINVKLAIDQDWPEYFSHFWTLAVEEQFYLLWPWVILYVPRRWLIPLTLMTVVLAPLLRFYLLYFEQNWVASYVLTGVSLDSLGMGALLALITRQKEPHQVGALLHKFAAPTGALVVAALEVYSRAFCKELPPVYGVLYDSGWALIFYRVVQGAWNGFAGPVGALLEWRPLTYLGEISYGLYVYHAFAPSLVLWTFRTLGVASPKSPPVKFLLFTGVTIVLAAASWHLLEKPLNDLKRHFAYERRPPSRGGAVLSPEAG